MIYRCSLIAQLRPLDNETTLQLKAVGYTRVNNSLLFYMYIQYRAHPANGIAGEVLHFELKL